MLSNTAEAKQGTFVCRPNFFLLLLLFFCIFLFIFLLSKESRKWIANWAHTHTPTKLFEQDDAENGESIFFFRVSRGVCQDDEKIKDAQMNL